ncbi:MAG TPA: alpha/beta hydrolase [Phycisphaerae bacterium]|nr:alpha/beta hydrolase [Phycisphaerae bacterium]
MRPLRILTWITALTIAFGACSQAQEQSRPADPQKRQALIQRFDKDGDGQLSQEERQAALKEWQKQRGDKGGSRRLPPGVKAMRDIEYARVDGHSLKLDLYLPADAPKPMPVIVFIHGGAWRSGSKNTCPALSMTTKGFAVMSIDYRLTDVAAFPAQIHDCKGAIRWVRGHAKEYGFDPDRIGVWGNSAGGHLVALLGTSGGVKEIEGDVGGNLTFSSRVQAVADFCGPTSFRLEDVKGLEQAEEGKTPEALRLLLGGTVQEKTREARLASPAEHVTPDDPPFLIAHGEKDNVVPVQQARILAAALKKAGVETVLHIDPNAGHGVGNPQTIGMAEEFLVKHLKGKSNEPATKSAP